MRGGGGHEKPICRGDCLKRGGLDSLLIQGGLGKKEGVVFLREGGLIPQCPLCTINLSKAHLLYNQLTARRFHIQVLVLLKIEYFQEKVTSVSVPV